jgi:hypothetical protein
MQSLNVTFVFIGGKHLLVPVYEIPHLLSTRRGFMLIFVWAVPLLHRELRSADVLLLRCACTRLPLNAVVVL